MSGDSRFTFRKPRVFVRVLGLRRTNLCGADLVGQSLVEALDGAKWDYADLHRANLRANLRASDILERSTPRALCCTIVDATAEL